ncbi:MAG: preprotein translocase subunit SecE [Chloroflexota bacterium]
MADEKKPNAISRYFRETVGELRKVSWPTRREALQLSLIVVVVMVIMGIYLSLVDGIGASLIKLVVSASS